MNVFILAESLRTGDAVGNNVIQEYRALTQQGHRVRLYASNFDDYYAPYLIGRNTLRESIKGPEPLILYHHSIFWEEGALILKDADCRVYLRYHNITPDHFFAKYSDLFYRLSKQGRQQTQAYVASGKVRHYIADSAFNAAELVEYGAPPATISVLAPFHSIGDFDKTRVNLTLLKDLLDGRINILSVGRIVPNKGLHHAIEVIEHYLRYYGDNVRFNIVGEINPNFQGYVDELEGLVARHGMDDYVFFRGKVSFVDLHTYYVASHILLLMSEHEGFCLPILEAQYHQLPVIALDRCAVKETIGAEQFVVEDIDYLLFSSAIHAVAHDNDMRTYLVDNGHKNYLSYHSDILSKRLAGIIHDDK